MGLRSHQGSRRDVTAEPLSSSSTTYHSTIPHQSPPQSEEAAEEGGGIGERGVGGSQTKKRELFGDSVFEQGAGNDLEVSGNRLGAFQGKRIRVKAFAEESRQGVQETAWAACTQPDVHRQFQLRNHPLQVMHPATKSDPAFDIQQLIFGERTPFESSQVSGKEAARGGTTSQEEAAVSERKRPSPAPLSSASYQVGGSWTRRVTRSAAGANDEAGSSKERQTQCVGPALVVQTATPGRGVEHPGRCTLAAPTARAEKDHTVRVEPPTV